MKNIKNDFWRFAQTHSKQSNTPVELKDIFLKWAAQKSLKIADAQDYWKQIQADLTVVDNGKIVQGPKEEVQEVLNGSLAPESFEVGGQTDITEEMKDAIEEKKEEKQETEETEQLTLMDSLAQEDEEVAEPTGDIGGVGELPKELPPLPEGSV